MNDDSVYRGIQGPPLSERPSDKRIGSPWTSSC
jgi:hypothetical protein